MGFRTGAIAKVWGVSPITNTMTRMEMSISKKNKMGEYETEWSGFAVAVGTALAAKAAKLGRGDRIKLGDVDASRRYDKENNKEYINWKVFSFEKLDSNGGGARSSVDNGEPELPF